MPLVPRKDEIDMVVGLLESDAYESARDMARALILAVHTELSKRECFVVFPQGGVVGHGPYPSSKDAERAWSKGIGETYGSQGRLLRVRPFDPADAERGGTCVCGHVKEIHADKGKCAAFYVGATGPKAKTRPQLPQCGCGQFTQKV